MLENFLAAPKLCHKATVTKDFASLQIGGTVPVKVSYAECCFVPFDQNELQFQVLIRPEFVEIKSVI